MDIKFADAPGRSRYELTSGDDVIGFIDYALADGVITMIHTEVGEAYSGQGHAATLARSALDDARSRGLSVVPSCPYVAAYIRKHEEYADLVKA
ncbi:putative GNAT family acetyltransferase [Nocardioides sp. BE266]|uniref:GNAT family N-acetyltransferase n=1 Tax=Nocardioides sp. BE266 TaxID=2817725 RepID=UPI0028643159|nr:GNAT family N-acetyltransferase [Nocardioides sp. BE266]MDR7253003.1 putative GNAT family acetyltransferase [Nocardioides sp. BE266]